MDTKSTIHGREEKEGGEGNVTITAETDNLEQSRAENKDDQYRHISEMRHKKSTEEVEQSSLGY